MKSFPKILFCVLLVSAFAAGCDRFTKDTASETSQTNTAAVETSAPLPSTEHLAFGNPTNATRDENNETNFLVIGDGSAFSYNNERGTVNWISWKTTKANLGNSIPRPDFRPDPRLPTTFNRIGYFDYSGSGYDRGHMVPSADRFADPRLNEETFLMTNIVPQTGALNQFAWEQLESYARSQAWRGWDVYQIAGVYGDGKVLRDKVVAPTNCWKIVMLLPRGLPTDKLDQRTRLIAVDMPNIRGIENDRWEKYKTTVRKIEERTGLNFFSNLSKDLQDTIETRIETANTQPRKN